MRKLIIALLLIPTLSAAQTAPQQTPTGFALTCSPVTPVLGKTMIGCDPATGSLQTVSPTGVVAPSTAKSTMLYNNITGPPPMVTFTKAATSTVLVFIITTGGRTNTANTTVSAQITINGGVVGTLYQHFNQAGVHLPMSRTIRVVGQTQGAKTFQILPVGGLIMDVNDYTNVLMWEEAP